MNSSHAPIDTTPASHLPYLSHSRLAKYLLCPEQYRLYYVENLRPRIADASLVFGQIVHQALSALFKYRDDPIEFFNRAWKEVERIDLIYGKGESWSRFDQLGRWLLRRFIEAELPKLQAIGPSEKPFRLAISSVKVALIGVIDLIATMNGKRTIVDFKTAAAAYPSFEVALSDQLTTYQLAEPDAEQVAFCVFVKTKEPKIVWYTGQRQPVTLSEYLAKIQYVAGEISAGRFHKRSGRWCSYCDYLPVCLGDQVKSNQTLVQMRPHQ